MFEAGVAAAMRDDVTFVHSVTMPLHRAEISTASLLLLSTA